MGVAPAHGQNLLERVAPWRAARAVERGEIGCIRELHTCVRKHTWCQTRELVCSPGLSVHSSQTSRAALGWVSRPGVGVAGAPPGAGGGGGGAPPRPPPGFRVGGRGARARRSEGAPPPPPRRDGRRGSRASQGRAVASGSG